MGYLLFIFYAIFFCWLITRIKFFTESGLSNRLLIILFLIRIIASLANDYINLYYYPVSDSVSFHEQGIVEYNLLFSNVREYFTNIFHTNYTNYSGFIESSDSFWNDLRTNIIAKILSIFDIFSRKNFFINGLIFNFCIFFGSLYFYKVFIKNFPFYRVAIIVCIFLLPSALYFTSGIHRDGFIFLALSTIIYHVYFMMINSAFPWRKILFVTISLCFILLLRNFVFITLLPALIGWIISDRYSRFAFVSFLAVYTVTAALFFYSGWISPNFDLPQHVSTKQIEFIEIAKYGASAININPLYPNFRSFLNNAPQAFNHSLMRPYLTEKFTLLYVPAALEIFVYECLFILFIFFRKRNEHLTSFIYFCLFFSLSMFLMIGYTIPIIGAIVRYRSIYFPLLLIPIISLTDWGKIKAFFSYSK